MDIHVCQAFSRSLGRAVGNELREFVLNCALVDPNTEGVCAVTRTRGFRRTQTRTNETYESYVTRGDGSHDRGLLFHVGGGARVVRAVQNWRPADIENDGKGTLIEYPLREIRRARVGRRVRRRDVGALRTRAPRRSRTGDDGGRLRGDVGVRRRIGVWATRREDAIPETRPRVEREHPRAFLVIQRLGRRRRALISSIPSDRERACRVYDIRRVVHADYEERETERLSPCGFTHSYDVL